MPWILLFLSVSDLLRENQQEGEINPHPPRLGLSMENNTFHLIMEMITVFDKR